MERADYKREERQKESLRTSDFAFDLPKELIAQDPLADRSARSEEHTSELQSQR